MNILMGVLGKIFRLLLYMVLIIAGSILNYYIDSPVIVGVIMLGLSLTLNRGTNTKQQVNAEIGQNSRPAYVSRSIEVPRAVPRKTPVTINQSLGGVVATDYCPSCGEQNNSNAKYCAYCGAELKIVKNISSKPPEEGRYTSEEIMKQIVSLRDFYLSGGIDEQSYLNIHEKSIFIDGWDRRWAVGANSLIWYRYESGNWVKDIPTGTLIMN